MPVIAVWDPTKWYSLQILLRSDDTVIFDGFFSIFLPTKFDNIGSVLSFYDASGNNLFVDTGFVGADSTFVRSSNEFSEMGFTTKSFPYLNNTYNNNYFLIKQVNDQSGFGELIALNIGGLYQLNVLEVKFINTRLSSQPALPIPPELPEASPTTFWYSTKVILANAEIFNGFFSVVRQYTSDTYGFVNNFYDASVNAVDIFVNDGFVGADRVFYLDTLQFSSTGTTMTSFPYFKNLYSDSAVYSFQHSLNSDAVTVVQLQGQFIDTINVTITNTLNSGQLSRILWYSTKILLQSDDTELFSGFLSVVQQNPFDTTGLVNHFYDVSGNDLFTNTGFIGADSLFLIDYNRFSDQGVTSKSFPYLNNIYNNNYFLIRQDQDQSGFGQLIALNLLGNYQLSLLDVKFVSTPISVPLLPVPPSPPPPNPTTFWFSTRVKLGNAEIFSGYFSVVRQYPSDTYGLINIFYDASNNGVEVLVNDGFVGADRVFFLDTLRFSSTGTTMTSFPYLLNLYTESAVYSFQQNAISDSIAVIRTQGSVLGTINVTITNTQFADPASVPQPPVTLWYSTKVKLASNNTEIFNGYFSVLKDLSSSLFGLITNFYDASNVDVDILTTNGYYNADRLFSFNNLNFSDRGTNISSFPYIKSIYSDSAFYWLWHSTTLVSNIASNVTPIKLNGLRHDSVHVTFTNNNIYAPLSIPPTSSPTTLWYSTKILLRSDDTEIFSGFFTVVQQSSFDTTGLINHFYDASGNDLLSSTGFVGADRIFSVYTLRFSYEGLTTKSFPYLNNKYNNNYFLIKQIGDESGFGELIALNLQLNYQLNNLEVKFIHTRISQPTLPIVTTPATPSPTTFWFTTKVTLANTEIFNGYFSVVRKYPSDTYGVVTEFYDVSNELVNILVNDGFVGADRIFFLDTLHFSSTGTTMTSFPYFKNLYSSSGVYSFQHSAISDAIAVVHTEGNLLHTINVSITSTLTSNPFPLPLTPVTLWYSTQIKLAGYGYDIVIFNGYFSVFKELPSSPFGLITHFYDASNVGVDILTNNGYSNADRLFYFDILNFSNRGLNITSFPWIQATYTNSVYYWLWHSTSSSPGNASSVVPISFDGIRYYANNVVFTNTQISGPLIREDTPNPPTLWYSTKILLRNDNTLIFNGYFSVVKQGLLGLITHFYDASGNGTDLLTTIGVTDGFRLFTTSDNRIISRGLATKSFPFTSNKYNNNYFHIKPTENSEFCDLIVFNLLKSYILKEFAIKIINTAISEPSLPVPPLPPTPNPTTFWFSTKVSLGNTEIFSGYFSVIRQYPSDTYGLVNSFYSNSLETNVFVNDGFLGADRVFFLDTLKFSSTGTTMTSFPYLKNIHNTSAVYSFQHTAVSDTIAVVHSQGTLLDTISVTITNTEVSDPLSSPNSTTLWYSTKILLRSDDTQLFSGYFSVVRKNQLDVSGLVNHFYDASGNGTDLFRSTGFFGANRVFSLDTLRFSYEGLNTKSFPYLNNKYNNNYFLIKQIDDESGFGELIALNLAGSYQLNILEVKFIHTAISQPSLPIVTTLQVPSPTTFWYSTKVTLAETVIFNGYFSVVRQYPLNTYGVVNKFYDNSLSTNVFVNDGFVGADGGFLLDTLRFSSNGTTMTSFPYLKSLYSTSAVYSFQRDVSSDTIAVIQTQGSLLDRVNVTVTNQQISDPFHVTPYVNNVYAFEASGGFQMLRSFDDITLRQQLLLDTYDVTNSVQIMLDVAWFNSYLGIYKNATNDALVSSTFDKVNDEFTYADGVQVDSIIFTANDLRECLVTHKQIISVGAFTPLYTNFTNYVRYYFGFHGGFSSLFVGASEFAVDPSKNNVFNSESIFKLIHGETEITSGGVIKDLTGYVRIGDITKSLRSAVDTNCFGNRTPTIIDESGTIVEGSGTAIDPVNKSNYGVNDGFVAGDLIFVPTGFSITLNVRIQSDSLQSINNTTPTPFTPTSTTTFNGQYASEETLSTRTLIDRKSKAPLLIKLVNASTIAAL